MKPRRVLVSDSVTEGHPDKLCDQISDAVVDHCLSLDPLARIDVECTVSTGIVFIAAHYDTEAELDFVDTARTIIKEAGYDSGEFNARDCTVLTSLNKVRFTGRPVRREEDLDEDEIERLPAQQQVTVFGYACAQTQTLMPLSITLAHELAKKLDEERRAGRLAGLLSDGKSQVGLEYVDGTAERVHSICLRRMLQRSREIACMQARASVPVPSADSSVCRVCWSSCRSRQGYYCDRLPTSHARKVNRSPKRRRSLHASRCSRWVVLAVKMMPRRPVTTE